MQACTAVVINSVRMDRIAEARGCVSGATSRCPFLQKTKRKYFDVLLY